MYIEISLNYQTQIFFGEGVYYGNFECMWLSSFSWYLPFLYGILQEFRAFELLRSGTDRSEYLLIKEAKIIAMTCTHAALKRRDLVAAGFKVRNINYSKTSYNGHLELATICYKWIV